MATDGEVHVQKPVLVHRVGAPSVASTCYLLCLLLQRFAKHIIAELQLVHCVMTARCALTLLAECPEIWISSAAKAACECCHDYCYVEVSASNAIKQQLLPGFKSRSATEPWTYKGSRGCWVLQGLAKVCSASFQIHIA